MLTFSDDLLRIEPGHISYLSTERTGPDAGTWSIDIPIAPFSADSLLDPETFRPGRAGPELVETAIQGDFIELPGADLSALSGRTFDFRSRRAPARPAARQAGSRRRAA